MLRVLCRRRPAVRSRKYVKKKKLLLGHHIPGERMGRTVRTNDPSPRRQPWRRPLAASFISIYFRVWSTSRHTTYHRRSGVLSLVSYRRCGVEIYYVGYLLATPRQRERPVSHSFTRRGYKWRGGRVSAPATGSQDLGGLHPAQPQQLNHMGQYTHDRS